MTSSRNQEIHMQKSAQNSTTMATKVNDSKKKISWVGDIAPMLHSKLEEFKNPAPFKFLLNFKRVQSHSRHLLPDLKQGQSPMIGSRSMPLMFSEYERNLFSQYLVEPRLIDVDSVQDLKKAIQAAIEIEIATIPPYLAALYSLKQQEGYVFDALHRIIYQEMRHYGLACNLLLAIGGTPETITKDTLAPYPKQLPYGLGDGLPISIRKLTHGLSDGEGDDESALRQIETFMAIEKPDFMRVPRLVNGSYVVDSESKPEMTPNSIGELYADILTALTNLSENGSISFGNEELQVANGPTAHVPIFAITSLELAKQAIDIICSEGEGATDADDGLSPFTSDADSVPAHYFAFSEMYYGRRIEAQFDEFGISKGFSYTGAEISTTELKTYNMTDNPSLKNIPRDSDAFTVANNFAQKWYQLLQSLHDTFSTDKSAIDKAVRLMGECREAALQTMITELPYSDGKMVGPPFEQPIDPQKG